MVTKANRSLITYIFNCYAYHVLEVGYIYTIPGICSLHGNQSYCRHYYINKGSNATNNIYDIKSRQIFNMSGQYNNYTTNIPKVICLAMQTKIFLSVHNTGKKQVRIFAIRYITIRALDEVTKLLHCIISNFS